MAGADVDANGEEVDVGEGEDGDDSWLSTFAVSKTRSSPAEPSTAKTPSREEE